MSRVQVLIATMHQKDHSLLQKMNIETDAIVGNQCDRDEIEHFEYEGNQITYLNFKEKGVGLNRNNALMRAEGEICLFADDDMEYIHGYEDIVTRAFDEHPKADILLFNIDRVGDEKRRINEKETKINILNYLNYGAARIAFRRKAISYKGIFFNEHFGGGTEHLCGEDTLFLNSCLKKHVKMVAVPLQIATLSGERDSTWFEGYTDKYFFDKGVVMKLAHPILAKPFLLYLAFRHKEYQKEKGNFFAIYQSMVKGVKYIQKKGYKDR